MEALSLATLLLFMSSPLACNTGEIQQTEYTPEHVHAVPVKNSFWVRLLPIMQPMITIAMLPATYTAAMICKSCSDFIAVGLHVSTAEQLLYTDIWACHSGAASKFICSSSAAELPWV